MKFEDRIQLRLSDLTEELFENIVAYGFHAPSGMGGPGCVIMIAEDGRSYQFYGPDLNKLNYHREWASLFPVLNQRDTSRWKLAENVSCTKLLVRNDIYDLFMENRSTPEETIDYRWEDSCIKATLLLHARTEEEIEKINRRYELRTPLFEKDDLVEFYFDNGTKKTKCKGVIAGTDIYRIHGKIETIEYDIWWKDYENYRKKCLYKHIDENHIKATPGKLLILSGFSGVGKGTIIQQLLTEYPEKYVVAVSATTRKPRKGEVDGKSYHFKKREEFEDLINKNEFLEFAEYAGEYYGTLKKEVYKNYFEGKNVIIEIDSQGARQIRRQQKTQSVFLIPPSFDELLQRLKNRGTETEESIRRRLKQALDEIEHVEEYGVLLVNDSVEGTAFVLDALFHPVFKNASGMNERELKIAREIREEIIKYLSGEEGE
ncbi:guanylate kinase [Blautia stercoris]